MKIETSNSVGDIVHIPFIGNVVTCRISEAFIYCDGTTLTPVETYTLCKMNGGSIGLYGNHMFFDDKKQAYEDLKRQNKRAVEICKDLGA